MIRRYLTLSAMLPLALAVAGGCSSERETPAGDSAAGAATVAEPPAQEIVVDPTTASTRAVAGRTAYRQVCAKCHETGENGAPRTGDKAAWDDRSPLWEAVLFEHADEGYLDMPADGGSPLAEDAVEAAAEYMLSLTYPDFSPEDDR